MPLPMHDVWSQSLRGNAIDLMAPHVDDVDFPEIADTLSTINRYNGCALRPVSVALHTLIVIDAAPDAAKPYAALHDAPEARLGDQTRPWKKALFAEMERWNPEAAMLMKRCADVLHQRHFEVICDAAGLAPCPSDVWKQVKRADDVALVTERKHFMASCPLPWAPYLEALQPLRRPVRWLPPDKAADALMERFRQLLPVFRKHAA